MLAIALILIMVPLFSCNCPPERMHHMGFCVYNIHCIHDIKGIKIQRDCQGSTNYDVVLDVTLVDATDRFDTTSDLDFLSMISSLKVSGNWPETNLTFLENMYRMKTLHLINNNINHINDSPFRHLNRLEHLNLSRNHLSDIGDLFQFDSYPNKVKKLSLSFNDISEIPGDTFIELTNLIELDLSFNQISELYEEPFSNLTNLVILRLNNNRIKNVNGALNNLLNLKHLYLRVNQIQNIDIESIKIIYHLETFDISKNQLENLKPIVFSRHWYHFGDRSICKIILSENHIAHIPNATISNENSRKARNLFKQSIDVYTELDVSQNSITTIEYNAFQSIVRLTSLDVSCNRLTTFDINAKDLRFVKYLNISQNFLQTLHYKSFAAMINLQNLDLSHNHMDFFPDQSLSNNYQLKLLNLTFNDIIQVNSLRISFNRNGGVLDLSNNGLSNLNLPSGDAIGLTILILSSNNITEPFSIKLNRQPDLVQLDMSKNLIQELDESSLQLPVTLSLLDISRNYIERIGPSAFHRVRHLKTLRLSYNDLKGIEYGAFDGLTSLLNLDLAYNKIHSLDSKVLMDLKMLSVLSLRSNDLNYLDRSCWFAHKADLRVFLDDNDLSCDWVAKALNDFNNGYSKMRPTVLNTVNSGNSIEGIPCKQEVGNIISSPNYMTDERLLVINQKILEAVQEQTSFLRKNIWRFVLQDAERNATNNNY